MCILGNTQSSKTNMYISNDIYSIINISNHKSPYLMVISIFILIVGKIIVFIIAIKFLYLEDKMSHIQYNMSSACCVFIQSSFVFDTSTSKYSHDVNFCLYCCSVLLKISLNGSPNLVLNTT